MLKIWDRPPGDRHSLATRPQVRLTLGRPPGRQHPPLMPARKTLVRLALKVQDRAPGDQPPPVPLASRPLVKSTLSLQPGYQHPTSMPGPPAHKTLIWNRLLAGHILQPTIPPPPTLPFLVRPGCLPSLSRPPVSQKLKQRRTGSPPVPLAFRPLVKSILRPPGHQHPTPMPGPPAHKTLIWNRLLAGHAPRPTIPPAHSLPSPPSPVGPGCLPSLPQPPVS